MKYLLAPPYLGLGYFSHKYVALARGAGGGLTLKVVSVSSGDVVQEESFPAPIMSERSVGPAPVLSPTGLVLGTYPRKMDKSTGYRCEPRKRFNVVLLGRLDAVGLAAPQGRGCDTHPLAIIASEVLVPRLFRKGANISGLRVRQC